MTEINIENHKFYGKKVEDLNAIEIDLLNNDLVMLLSIDALEKATREKAHEIDIEFLKFGISMLIKDRVTICLSLLNLNLQDLTLANMAVEDSRYSYVTFLNTVKEIVIEYAKSEFIPNDVVFNELLDKFSKHSMN